MKPYLAVARVQKAESQFFLTTILASKFKRCTRTQAVDLLFVMLKLRRDVLPWLPCMLQTMTNLLFIEIFLTTRTRFSVRRLNNWRILQSGARPWQDKKGGRAKTHTESVKVLQIFMAEHNLMDAWRILNPDSFQYTWRRKKTEVHCRLDFFLVSQGLMCNVTRANISAGYKTDHSLITIKMALHSNQRGPGFWKLNSSFLSDINYVNQIRRAIQEVLTEYENDDDVNPALLWEMIKLKAAADKKTKLNRKEEAIERRINVLQNLIESNHIGEQEKQDAFIEQEEKKTELERIIEYRTKGAILRARCRWHNEGEKIRNCF